MKTNKRGGTLGLSFSLILLGSFLMALYIYMSQFAQDNNSIINIQNDTNLARNLSLVNGTLIAYYEGDNESVFKIYGSSIETGSDTLSRVSTFKSGNENTLPDYGAVAKDSIDTLFGGDPRIWIITGALLGLLALTVVLYYWQTLKAGNPN